MLDGGGQARVSQPPLRPLFVGPEILETIAVEDAIDHQGQPLDLGCQQLATRL
jgi:hypothetical protein